MRRIDYVRTAPDSAKVTVLSLNGLTFVADCTGGVLGLEASSAVASSYIQNVSSNTGGNNVTNSETTLKLRTHCVRARHPL